MKSRKTIAIVGSGSGNDVAAAIRAEIKDIDAVEIDPAIFQLGAYYHPEAPYSDPRVNVSIGDARSFLREGKKILRYDTLRFTGLTHSFEPVFKPSYRFLCIYCRGAERGEETTN